MRTMSIAVLALGLSFFSAQARAQPATEAPHPQGEAPWPVVAPPPSSPPPAAAPAPVPAAPSPPPYMMMQPQSPPPRHFLIGDSGYRSPGLAVVLSLTPLPVDFGNLYAENLGWGIAYTAIEVSLMMPMMWFVGRHMDHDGLDNRAWGGGERMGMMAMVGGYVVVKLIAGMHAGYAAREFNRQSAPRWSALVVPATGGAVASWNLRF